MPLSEANLTTLLVREHDRLVAYVWAIVRDDHLVADILQEVALVALRKRKEIVDETHFLRWMRTTCRLTALDALARHKRRPLLLGDKVLDLLDEDWAEEDTLPLADQMEALRHCMEQLSPYARQLIGMRYTEGCKSGEIAKKTGRNVATIYVALTRIHHTLADCIRARTQPQPPPPQPQQQQQEEPHG